MARIEKLGPAQRDRIGKHRSVSATFHVFEVDGETILQIDTYGSEDRQLPGKTSQSIQFGDEGLKALRAILSEI
jgi:hypothetical protein